MEEKKVNIKKIESMVVTISTAVSLLIQEESMKLLKEGDTTISEINAAAATSLQHMLSVWSAEIMNKDDFLLAMSECFDLYKKGKKND